MRFVPHCLAGLAAASALLASPAWAQSSTWMYANFTENAADAGAMGNSYSYTQSGVKLTVNAYSTTGAVGTPNTGATFAAAQIGNYGTGSGFGVHNGTEPVNSSGQFTSPQHSMDNYAHTDMLALSFTNSSSNAAVGMVLTELATGWHNTSTTTGLSCNGSQANCIDSDISLLRYSLAGTPTIAGKSISDLLSSGWVLVNNYANMQDDVSRTTGLNAGNAGSSWWLISAYNSAWGTGSNTTGLSNGDDFVKVLSSVSTVPTPPNNTTVPEPGSFALAGLALIGAVASRRPFKAKPARA